jgi:pectate lyase
MRAVTYTDTAVTPNNATRTISFSITDANSNVSNTATRTVTVADTDQSPIATTSGGSAAFVAGNNTASTPVAIDPGITVSDLDNTTLASATVSITGNFHSSEDVLAFTNNPATMGNIAGVYNSGTGVLTLTSSGATATIAQWQAALRSVTYTDTAVTPNNATRTISFVVNDGTVNGNTATRTVTVADTDQSPIITTSGGSAAFVAGNNTASTPVVIDSGITVSDLDNTTQASGTVSITGNFHSSEDVLAFNNTSATTFGNIVASYNSGTGVLTLTSSGATATIAQWRAALRAVTYTDTAVTPNNATRTISFVVNDGTVNSNTATRTVTVTDTDQSPIVTTSGGITNDLAGASAIAIDGSATVSDLDNTTQLSGTVSITGNFHSSEDVLAFTNNPATMGNILGSYNSGTGVLTLTSAGATATDAQWQAALRSVTYADTAVTPNTSNRTVSFVVNDGTRNSAAGTKTVSVTAVSASYPAPAPDGFASSATGGASTAAVTVTTAANFITQAQSSTPAVITVAGLLNLGATPVTVNSNKTIQGADANAALVGNLTLASGVSNVIIRGLNLTNPGTIIVGGAYTDGGDGITIAGASSVFITHCTFFDTANHAIAITNGADKITVSWCEFYYTAGQTVHRDSVLIGTPGAETAPLHVTLHHNFWSTNVDQQMPVATFGYVHLYSNDFDATGNTSATVSSDQAQLLSELNVYTGMASPLTVQNVNTALPIGRILALGNSYTTTTGTAPYSGLDQVFTPSYSYEALPVSDTAAVVSANAGNVAGAGYTDAAVGSASITGPTAAVTPATAFTLTSVPASFTPSTYQWRLGNLAISGATASTYTVSNTQSANAGIYTVAIGLVSGDVVVSTPFTVTLGAPPATTPAPAPDSGSSFPWYYFIGGGAMSDWFLGALAMLAAFREIQQRRRTRD